MYRGGIREIIQTTMAVFLDGSLTAFGSGIQIIAFSIATAIEKYHCGRKPW
jgi:hypothetical protein